MIIKCTCSDLVNNGDHYCPIHGTFAAPTPPEGEADQLSPLLDMSVVEGLSEELRKAKAGGEAVPEQRDKFCVFCGKTDHLEDGHKHIPGPRAVPNYCRYCGVQMQRSVGGAISFGTHKDDCPRNSPAAPVVSTVSPEPECSICGEKECDLPDTTSAPEPRKMIDVGGKEHVETPQCKYSGCNPVAPESYKPADEVSLQWPTNLPPTGMGAIDAITDLWTCDLKGLTAEEIKQAARIIDSLLEHVRRDPASTPVTVEAPAQPPCSECATLREKLEQWTKWGVVEVAVRNPQVAEYCEHWEGRAEKAEAECATLRKESTTLSDANVNDDCPLCITESRAEAAEAQLIEGARLRREIQEMEKDQAVFRPSELGSHGEANLPRDAAGTRQEKCSTALAPTPEVAKE